MNAVATPRLRMDSAPEHPELYTAMIREWERRTPWYRRPLARLGLQGKVMLSLWLLLGAALIITCWFFLAHGREQLRDTMGEQARQLANALSLSGRPFVVSNNSEELRRIASDLIKSRNVLFVAFLDADMQPLAVATRDASFDWNQYRLLEGDPPLLMQVREETAPGGGSYQAVLAPVLSMASLPSDESARGQSGLGTRLSGYVAVGVTHQREEAQLARMKLIALSVGVIILLISVPVAFLLVHRIFHPIRQLVDATGRMARGELDAQVAIDRPDTIGMLARSFNQMVVQVRRHQNELAEANRLLEQKVQERTAELAAANARLRNEIAEKEDFLRAVSHDLSAPLRNISGMTSMLLGKHREKLDEEVIHRLQRIQKNLDLENDLICELLELSRIKTRRQKLELVDVSALVADVVAVLENDLQTQGITLTVETPLPVLYCEKTRIRQIFLNLIDNAIKYMGEGRAAADGGAGSVPSKQIRIGCTVGAGGAEFYVADTGIGIPADEIDRIFFIFRRGRSGLASGVSGKGVGLASVKSIVETYGGSVRVESSPGDGSTFRFSIDGRFVPDPPAYRADEATSQSQFAPVATVS